MHSIEVVLHHLRIFGLPYKNHQNEILYRPSLDEFQSIRKIIQSGGVGVLIQPQTSCLANLGIVHHTIDSILDNKTERNLPLTTLHPAYSYDLSQSCNPVITDSKGGAVWVWLAFGLGWLLMIGTDLPNDLIRYRQGDPRKVGSQSKEKWGFSFERPNYLFEEQIAGQPKYARQADHWAELLAECLSTKLNIKRNPILPNGARGALIITGDDDQAFLEKYKEQLDLIGEFPITYFMHPQTKHTPKTIKKMLGRKNIDLGLHPDALDAPDQYPALLKEQVEWFTSKFKKPPISVRNHGFLNDGYWGHLGPWIERGLKFSSNLPGLDGRAINSSFLPARVMHNGTLTDHWSLLTAIGDGVIYILNYTDSEAAQCVYDAADAILQSGIPGVLVLNLHPQNIGQTRAMHHAAIDLVKEKGFHPWTIRECLTWFCQTDESPLTVACNQKSILNQLFTKFHNIITGSFRS